MLWFCSTPAQQPACAETSVTCEAMHVVSQSAVYSCLFEGVIRKKICFITKPQGISNKQQLEKWTLNSCRSPNKLIRAKELFCRHPASKHCNLLLMLSLYLSHFFSNFSAQGTSTSSAFQYLHSNLLYTCLLFHPFFSASFKFPWLLPPAAQKSQGWLPAFPLHPH